MYLFCICIHAYLAGLPTPCLARPLRIRLPALLPTNSHRSTWRTQRRVDSTSHFLSPGLLALLRTHWFFLSTFSAAPCFTGVSTYVPVPMLRHVPRIKLTCAISRLPTPMVSSAPLCRAQNLSSGVPWPVRVDALASSASSQLQSHVSQLNRLECNRESM
jgi:hypothetical protein